VPVNQEGNQVMTRAVFIQGWYLANLLILPGIAFFMVSYAYFKYVVQGGRVISLQYKDSVDVQLTYPDSAIEQKTAENNIEPLQLTMAHSRAAFWLSIVGGSCVFGGCLFLYFMVGVGAQAWPIIIVYFIMMHTVFVMWGMLNLARAMADRLPIFKLF
jgi:hypothetical protein